MAHTHVIICHRTGSKTNPYVVINISMSAWLRGHTTHPPLNGHDDILLKQDARPGEKLPRSACGGPGPVPPTDPPVTPPTPTPPTTTTTTTDVPIVPAPPVKPQSGGDKNSDSGAAPEIAVTAIKGELPFTGVPLWIVVLAAVGLLGSGLALRKVFRTRS